MVRHVLNTKLMVSHGNSLMGHLGNLPKFNSRVKSLEKVDVSAPQLRHKSPEVKNMYSHHKGSGKSLFRVLVSRSVVKS
jgi:hypothetical protein